jgi:hypothetical protein
MDLIHYIIKLEPKENYYVYNFKQDNFYNLYLFLVAGLQIPVYG